MNKNRIEAFSDGVLAIIITIMILEIKVPEKHSVEALKISVVITLICLFIFGFFKSKLTGVNPVTGGLKVMLIGAMAAAAAFGIAKLIEG